MAQIYLSSGETGALVGPGSNQVIGTNANESVNVVANGDATFDGSFNRGGDVINIAGNAGNYTASISGNFLVLTGVAGQNTAGADIRIPIGAGPGASIQFADASPRVLSASGTTVTLGSQTIPLTGSVTVTPGSGNENPIEDVLTPNQDIIVGTNGADFFLADMVQVNGLQVNSLGTGDNVNGAGGLDEIQAQITRAATFSGNGGIGGTNGGSNIPIQPRFNSIEVVRLEALNADLTTIQSPLNRSLELIGDIIEGTFGSFDEFSDYSNNTEVYFNARNVRGHDEIWSWYSDANLTVQDLTTIVANGGHDDARNTSEITIGMGYTSGQDTFWDSSDYHVFFDQDFLLTGIASESRAFYFLLDEDADLDGRPLLDFIDVDGIRFTINGGPVITLSDPDAQTAGTHAGFVAALQDALQDLKDAGLVPADTILYVDPTVTDFTFLDDGSQSSPIPAIVLETQTDSVITPVGFSRVEDAIGEYDVYGRFNNESAVEDLPLSVNIALEKVGRGGEGGDLIVGSMDKYNNGIDVFDVTVYGDDSRPSWLDYLNSTGDSESGVGQQGELDVINIVSDNEGFPDDDTWAALTIGATNDFLTLIDAQGFFGDLTLGNLDDFDDLVTLLATGGGDVTFYGDINDHGPTAYSYSTGAGDDLVDLEVDGSALEYATGSLFVSTGDGNDEVFVDYEYDESELPNHIILRNVDLNTGNGDDIVSTYGEGQFRINTGAGNDVIYSEQESYFFNEFPMAFNNTSTAHWVFNVDRGDYADEGGAGSIDLDSLPGVPLRYSLLAGATVTVTFSGAGNLEEGPSPADGGGAVMEHNGVNVNSSPLHPAEPVIGDAVAFKNGIESTATINLTGDGDPFSFYGTQVNINNAILAAINNHSVLNKLLLAEISANNTLVVSSKIDGTFVTEDLDIAIVRSSAYLPGPVPASEPTLPSALITEAIQLGLIQPGQVGASGTDQPSELLAIPSGFPYPNLLAAVHGAALDNGFYSGINNSPDNSSVNQFDNLWSSGDRAGNQSDHTHTPGTGDDVVVLSTDNNVNEDNEYWTLDGWLFDRASNETIVFQGDFSTINGPTRDTIVNFQVAGVEDYIEQSTDSTLPFFVPSGEDPDFGGFDFLDFTSYLTSQATTASGGQSVTRRISTSLEDRSLTNADGTSLVAELNPNTLPPDTIELGESTFSLSNQIDANEVYIVSFDNTGPGTSAQTFSGLTATVVAGLINGTAATTFHGSLDATELTVNRTYVNTAPGASLVNGAAKAILMIQNADDLGVYKVFEVTWNGLASANSPTVVPATVVERGTVDFGTSLDGLDELNLVGSLEHSLFNFDLSAFTNP